MELEADLARVGPGRLDPVILDDGAEEGVVGRGQVLEYGENYFYLTKPSVESDSSFKNIKIVGDR